MTPTITIIVIVSYFAVLLLVGQLAARRSGGSNAEFFNGGRRVAWPLVTIAMIGAAISGVTFISVPGMVVGKGYSYVQMMLGFLVGSALIAWVLVPLFYKRNLISIYGYLNERFGPSTYKSGAWLFFVSKMLGAGVRFYVVCAVLQMLVFDPLGLPFELNVLLTIALIWLYTARGGVKTVIWTDVVKSLCLIGSVALCIVFIAADLGLDLRGTADAVVSHPTSRAFYIDDPKSPLWFGKQFLAGIFMVVVMTGLDQDMMQRNLACRDSASSRKNIMIASVLQFFVIGLFLVLGTLLTLAVEAHPELSMPEKTDDLFGLVATSPIMPVVVGIVFVLGLVSAAYSAAGSALTALTTSFSIDILGYDATALSTRRRRMVHLAMSVVMGLVIIAFYYLSSEDAISAVYTLASYTYGPILGLFAFGLLTRRVVADRWLPVVCVCAPVMSWLLQRALYAATGYQTGFELLLINAALTAVGLALLSRRPAPASAPA